MLENYIFLEKVFRRLSFFCLALANIFWRGKLWADLQRYKIIKKPWSHGYIETREKFLVTTLNDESILKKFRDREALPNRYGKCFDERVIELPWFLSQLSKVAGGRPFQLLDAGSACNHIFYLPFLKKLAEITILTLAPEAVCENKLGISYSYGDLRNMPFKDNLFDVVVSISTLEHIGMNNEQYKPGVNENLPMSLFSVLTEVVRVLSPGGMFFFSVPFGKYCNYKTFQQFDSILLAQCRNVFMPVAIEENFYLYSNNGWQLAEEKDCANIGYAAGSMQNGVVAAGAVACCAWRKSQ